MSREDFARLLCELKMNSGVEVGVHRGYFSSVLLDSNPDLNLASVDIWNHQEIYFEAVRELRRFSDRNILIRLPSVRAAEMIDDESLDFVYVDGDHTKKGCLTDLRVWDKKLRVGGIMSGHDYKVSNVTRAAVRCKVFQAVNEFVAERTINPFFVIGESFECWPSFFWVKESRQ